LIAQDEQDVQRWFRKYRETLKEYKIKRRNIINFDEAGFQVGCMKGQWILVPLDVTEFYALSPENRQSLTIFEVIDATGRPPPPLMIVVQGKKVMGSWFPPEFVEQNPDAFIIASEKGFTNNEIAVEFLRHFIRNSNARPHSDWKLLLMDNHGSHETPEFIKLANENHILPYPLLAHMTHCMQPLDVGVFQPYKHWHNVAIKDAIASLDIEYGLRSFLRDLAWVWEQTFKKRTIRHAFKDSGIYPPDTTKCLQQLKTFNPPKERKEASLPTLPRTPTKPMEVEVQLDK
jgi:hypothetical protein